MKLTKITGMKDLIHIVITIMPQTVASFYAYRYTAFLMFFCQPSLRACKKSIFLANKVARTSSIFVKTDRVLEHIIGGYFNCSVESRGEIFLLMKHLSAHSYRCRFDLYSTSSLDVSQHFFSSLAARDALS